MAEVLPNSESPQRAEVIEFLIKQGVNVDCRDNCCCTPLWYATAFCQRDIAEALLDAKADVNASDQNGTTILQLCVTSASEKADLTKMLLDRVATGATPLWYAAAYGHADLVKLLTKHGADAHWVNKDGLSTLHAAVIGLIPHSDEASEV